MPGAAGIPDVVARVNADLSGYKSEWTSAVPVLKEVLSFQQQIVSMAPDVARAFQGMGGAPAAAAAVTEVGKLNAAYREQLAVLGQAPAAVREYASAATAAAKATADLGTASSVTVEQIRAHASTVGELTQAYSKLPVAAFEALDQTKMSWNEVHAALEAIPAVYGDVKDSVDSTAASLGEMAGAQGELREALLVYRQDATRGYSDVAAAAVRLNAVAADNSAVTNLGAIRDTARDAESALRDASRAGQDFVASTQAATSDSGAAAGIRDLALAQFLRARSAAQAGGGSALSDMGALGAAIAAGLAGLSGGGRPPGGGFFPPPPGGYFGESGGGGGGGYGVFPFLSPPAGPQPGGGGGGFLTGATAALAGFAGGALSGIGGGSTASSQWRTAATAIATWYPRIHWAMMGINEVLATAGPAVVAGLAAGAVGLEGGQTAYSRVSAINAVGQSIGPSLGTTPGKFLGLGDSLQKAQTAADPQVWELMGAAINSVKAGTDSATGGLGSFWQMGTNTIDMMDRFGAQVTLDFKHGLGQELSGAVAGGTQDLQQFGDVLGNVGDTFLHVVPSLPGVGSDLLTVLQGATKGLSVATQIGSQTGLLGPLLALEAGSRYGPALVGGAASLVGRVGQGLTAAGAGGIGGVLGTAARAATKADVAAGLAAAEGDIIPATGIAGALGGLGPLQIGGIAAATYLTAKGIGYQTPEQQKVAALQSQIGTDNFTSAYSGILSGINQLSPVASQAPPGAMTQALSPLMELGNAAKHGNLVEGINSIFHLITDTKPPTAQSVAQSGIMQMTQQYGELLNAGKQVASVFKVSVPEAFTLADQAGLQLSTALGPGGKLSAISMQQIVNAQTGLMSMTGGMGSPVYNAGVNAIQVSQGLAGSKLSTLNAAYDQIVQNAAGGTTSAVGFSGGMQALASLALPAAQKAPSAKTVRDLQAALGISSTAAQQLASSGGTAESVKSVAQALTGFTSPGSQAAWAAFSSTSTTAPGMIQTVESMMDQLRTAQASGVLSQAQVAGAGAYEARQLLPYAAKSPAALAQLGIISQEAGGPAYQAGESQKQNLAAIGGFLDKASTSAKGYTATQNQMAVGMSNVSRQAQNFSSVMSTDVANTMAGAAASMPKATAAMSAFSGSIGSKNLDTGALKTVVSTLKGAGESAPSIQLMMKDIGSLHGASKAQLGQISEQVQVDLHPVVNAGAARAAAQAAIQSGMHVNFKLPTPSDQEITFKSKVVPPVIPHVGNQIFDVTGHVHMPAIPKVPNQTFTVTGYVNMVGAGSATLTGGAGNARFVGQSGFRVPGGYGGGDIVPAMLEPGEAVVPKHLVSSVAPFLGANKVPGFAAGGIAYGDVPNISGVGVAFRIAMQETVDGLVNALNGVLGQVTSGIRSGGSSYGLGGPGGLRSLTGGPPPNGTVSSPVAVHVVSMGGSGSSGGSGGLMPGGGLPVPAAASKIFDAFEKTFAGMPSPWKGLASQILNGLIDGIKNAKGETAAMATTLVNKVKTEIAYGQGVTATAVQGLNLGGMQVATPTMTAQGKPYQYYTDQQNIAAGGQPGSVQEQMGSYLQAMQSFQGDMGKLAKGGLEKRLMQQLYAAGPVQGDAEAQSILGGQGGIKAANQLYNQINSVATKLGVSAVGNVYGMPHPALQGKNVKVGVHADTAAAQAAINSIHGKTVVIKVQVEAGGGSGGSGGVNLSSQQINAITGKVQAALLQQAKRNRKTGLQLPGYGS